MKLQSMVLILAGFSLGTAVMWGLQTRPLAAEIICAFSLMSLSGAACALQRRSRTAAFQRSIARYLERHPEQHTL